MEGRALIKSRTVAFVIFVVLFMIFWNLLDFIWVTLISKSPYHFSVGTDLGTPLVIALVSGYLLFLRDNSK